MKPAEEIMHVALRQAVAILNVSPEMAKLEDGRRVRDILRTALHDYANTPTPQASSLPFDPGYVHAYLKSALLSVEPDGCTDPEAAYFLDWLEQIGTAHGVTGTFNDQQGGGKP